MAAASVVRMASTSAAIRSREIRPAARVGRIPAKGTEPGGAAFVGEGVAPDGVGAGAAHLRHHVNGTPAAGRGVDHDPDSASVRNAWMTGVSSSNGLPSARLIPAHSRSTESIMNS